MGINNDGTRNTEQVAENKIRRFAADSGQGSEFFHGVWDFPIILFQKDFGAFHNITRFGMIKTTGMDITLNLFNICLGKGFKGRETFIESGSNFVYSLIGALCGETHGEKKLVGLFIIKSAVCLRVFRKKQTHYIFYLFRSSHLWIVTVPPHSRTGN